MAVTFTSKAAGEMRGRLRTPRRRGRRGPHLPLGRARAAQLLLADARRRHRAEDRRQQGAAARARGRRHRPDLDTADPARRRVGDRVAQGHDAQHRPVRRARTRAVGRIGPAVVVEPADRVREAQGRTPPARLRGRAARVRRDARGRAARRRTPCTSSTGTSRSTSSRTSRPCSTACSSCGSATGATSASSATRARRSTRSRAPMPASCSSSRAATTTRRSCGSRRTTDRMPRCSPSRTS